MRNKNKFLLALQSHIDNRDFDAIDALCRKQTNKFCGWLYAAQTLAATAKEEEDSFLCQEAIAKYNIAMEYASTDEPEQFQCLYCGLAAAWVLSGILSEEVCDFKNAIDMFRKAADNGCEGSLFHMEYGMALQRVACILECGNHLKEAYEHYKIAIDSCGNDNHDAENFVEALLLHAQCATTLFEATVSPQYFKEGLEAFNKAQKLASDTLSPLLWQECAKLLLLGGKVSGDPNLLEECCRQCAQADALEPNQPALLAIYAEALTILGDNQEELSKLRQAEEKIAKAIDIEPANPLLWGIYGVCLCDMGRYFQDPSYLHKSVEKFQHALSIDHSSSRYWFGLAGASQVLYELSNAVPALEKALRCYNQAAEFTNVLPPHFWNDWGIALMKMAEATDNSQHLFAALNKFEQALTDAAVVEELCPFLNREIMYNYGCALDYLGDYEEDPVWYEKAVNVLQKVLEGDDDLFAHAHYNLAVSLSHLGESVGDIDLLNKAHDQFQRAIDADAEEQQVWLDWGVNHIDQALLLHDPVLPHSSRHHFSEAESKLLHAASLGSRHAYYNLACLYSLTSNNGAAIHYVEKAAHTNTLPPIAEVMHDEWLEGLRQTPEFAQFLSRYDLPQGH